jgi:hypothetical protein
MPQDSRENDKIILDRLEKIQDDSTQLKINLALNTQATKSIETNVDAIEDHLKTLNGKVLTQASSIQALQAADIITAKYIADSDKVKEKKGERVLGFKDKALWMIIGGGLFMAQRILTYLIESYLIKKIFGNH